MRFSKEPTGMKSLTGPLLPFEMCRAVYPLHPAKIISDKRNWHAKFSLTILQYWMTG